MSKFIIYGASQIKGEVKISGAKNSALPILFFTLLTESVVEIKNIPKLKDIYYAIDILINLGSKIEFKDSLYVDTSNIDVYCVPNNLFKKIRASIWILGPLVARFGYSRISLPGGCDIGKRPIDIHIDGLKKLGAYIKEEENYIKASSLGRLKGAHIFMKKISVGATLTVMGSATLANGTTIIENAACEPEIVDSAKFLIKLGAKIYGAGTKKIIIEGVKKLTGGSYTIMPDRIETATFLVAAAVSRGCVICYNTIPKTLDKVLAKLRKAGANIEIGDDWIKINMFGQRPKAVNINTSPYPGFPTDMQAQFSLLNTIAKGKSIIIENIFENRFMHIPELIRMGANIKIKNNMIICYGVKKLFGSYVVATDLRASISLVLAGCIADGLTVVDSIYHIDRGYSNIEKKLNSIGANITRIHDN